MINPRIGESTDPYVDGESLHPSRPNTGRGGRVALAPLAVVALALALGVGALVLVRNASGSKHSESTTATPALPLHPNAEPIIMARLANPPAGASLLTETPLVTTPSEMFVNYAAADAQGDSASTSTVTAHIVTRTLQYRLPGSTAQHLELLLITITHLRDIPPSLLAGQLAVTKGAGVPMVTSDQTAAVYESANAVYRIDAGNIVEVNAVGAPDLSVSTLAQYAENLAITTS